MSIAISLEDFVAYTKLRSIVKVKEYIEGIEADSDLVNLKNITVGSHFPSNKVGRNSDKHLGRGLVILMLNSPATRATIFVSIIRDMS